MLISEVNDLFGIHLIADDVDTIGGWIMVQKQIVAEGDIIEKHGFSFKVLKKICIKLNEWK